VSDKTGLALSESLMDHKQQEKQRIAEVFLLWLQGYR
jgi:hypothetical protein